MGSHTPLPKHKYLCFALGVKMADYTIDELKEAVQRAECVSDVCKNLNITICSFNYNRIRALCKKHSISLDHFDVKKTFRRKKKNWSYEDVFVENTPISRTRLRPLCIKYGLYTGKCDECGISDMWNGKPLTIEIDHINGINDDNRIENLRWLCPNCHSQTETYRNRFTRHQHE